jgi:hypothetical protein
MRRFDRRDFLAATSVLGGATALGTPAFLRNALAQTGAAPKRFMLIYMPNSNIRARWLSTGGRDVDAASGTASQFTLNTLTQPLMPIMPHTTLIHGINTDAVKGDQHSAAQIRVTTGMDVAMPNEGGGGGNLPMGPSLDTLAAEKSPLINAAGTTFKQLVLSADSRGLSLHHLCISSDMNNAFIPPDNQPLTVFNRLFTGANVGVAGATAQERAAALEKLFLRKKSVLDFMTSDLARLQKRIPSSQRPMLQSHLSAVQALEKTLAAQAGAGTSASTATLPPAPTSLAANNSANHPKLVQSFFDIVRTAFQLDLTRVVSLAFGTGNSAVNFADFGAGPSGGVHNIAHQSKTATTIDALSTITLWYGARVTEFVQSLAAIPEAGGTMLDNTLILFFSETGQYHEHNDLPLAVIGGKNLGNVGNRVLRYSRQVNDVGMAILKQLQVPVTTFGDARWFKGPAPELFA